jgi:hypothetical protein
MQVGGQQSGRVYEWAGGAYLGPPSSVLVTVRVSDHPLPSVMGVWTRGRRFWAFGRRIGGLCAGFVVVDGGSAWASGAGRLSLLFGLAGARQTR